MKTHLSHFISQIHSYTWKVQACQWSISFQHFSNKNSSFLSNNFWIWRNGSWKNQMRFPSCCTLKKRTQSVTNILLPFVMRQVLCWLSVLDRLLLFLHVEYLYLKRVDLKTIVFVPSFFSLFFSFCKIQPVRSKAVKVVFVFKALLITLISSGPRALPGIQWKEWMKKRRPNIIVLFFFSTTT